MILVKMNFNPRVVWLLNINVHHILSRPYMTECVCELLACIHSLCGYVCVSLWVNILLYSWCAFRLHTHQNKEKQGYQAHNSGCVSGCNLFNAFVYFIVISIVVFFRVSVCVCVPILLFYLVWYTVCLPYSRTVVVIAFFVLILGLSR